MAPIELAVTTHTPARKDGRGAANTGRGWGARKEMKTQGRLQKRGVFQPVLPSPSDPYNHTVSHFATAMTVGEKPTCGTVSKLDPVPAPPQAPRRALDCSGVLRMQLQRQNRAPESVTSQNSENEKAKSFGSQNPRFPH